MTLWDFLPNHIPLWFATPAFILAAAGFCYRGLQFFKFGFGKLPDISSDEATKAALQRFKIKYHADLDNFLEPLCGILRDKGILTNAESVLLKQTLKD
jgi:hypothetical protein